MRAAAAALALAAAAALVSPCAGRPPEGTLARALEWAGRTRHYHLHVPPGLAAERAAPLVIALHGGGGSGPQMERFTRLDALADREGFLVAYPSGVERNWYDGREGDFSTAHRERYDDAGFVAAMVDAVDRERRVDRKRVYATGISNGAFFSHYLAATRPDLFAAIAPVVGGIADPFHQRFAPSEPVSVLVIQGTDDPLVPYGGGVVGGRRFRGRLIPTEEAARLWAQANGCDATPEAGELPDTADDECSVRTLRYSGCRAGSAVLLYKLLGGGHTWPGGRQYLPARLIGRVCRDFGANEAIWRFFAAHAKP
jgi:polyhydroxybutyrate depolymerase